MMHIHNVYFWLKQDLDRAAVDAFEQGLAELAGDPEIKSGYFGRPAGTERDVVENSYDYGLVFLFEDRADPQGGDTQALEIIELLFNAPNGSSLPPLARFSPFLPVPFRPRRR